MLSECVQLYGVVFGVSPVRVDGTDLFLGEELRPDSPRLSNKELSVLYLYARFYARGFVYGGSVLQRGGWFVFLDDGPCSHAQSLF